MSSSDVMDRLRRHLKMRELRVLLAVVENGSFRKAASALHVTQPAVTAAIADLEAVLGVRLFDRNAQGVVPTVHGRSFIRHAAAMFGEMRSAAEELDIISSGAEGTLHVGTVPMPAAGILPVAICRLVEQHPKVFVSVVEGNETTLSDGLRTRQLDVVLSRLSQFGPGEDLRIEALFEDSLCVIASRDHRLAASRRLAWRDLLGEAWVLPPADSFFRHHIQRVLNKRGFELPRHAVESTSIHIMYGMIAQAPMLSFATCTQYAFSPLKDLLVRLAIDLPSVTASVGAVWLRAREATPLSEQLVRHVHELATKL